MKKLFTIIAIVTLLIITPATGAFAFLDNNSVDNSTNANADADANTTVNNTITFPEPRATTTVYNNGKGYRGFANPAETTMAPMPSYFGKATRNYNVQPAKAMVMFMDTYTRKQLESIMTDVKANVSRHTGMVPKADRKPGDKITVVFDIPDKDSVLQRALITTHAKKITTKSCSVLFGSMLVALNYGADLLYVTAEGASSELRSFGWGVGLAYTRATLSHDESTGGVAAGGFGISGGKAGYRSYPWLQTIALKKK